MEKLWQDPETHREIISLLSYDCFLLGGGFFLSSIRMMLIHDTIYTWSAPTIDLRRMPPVTCIFFLSKILMKK